MRVASPITHLGLKFILYHFVHSDLLGNQTRSICKSNSKPTGPKPTVHRWVTQKSTTACKKVKHVDQTIKPTKWISTKTERQEGNLKNKQIDKKICRQVFSKHMFKSIIYPTQKKKKTSLLRKKNLRSTPLQSRQSPARGRFIPCKRRASLSSRSPPKARWGRGAMAALKRSSLKKKCRRGPGYDQGQISITHWVSRNKAG